MRINDTGDSGGGTARVRGFETITNVTTGTGTGLFPTDPQMSGGFSIMKSYGVGSASTTWVLIATQTMFYLWTNPTNSANITNESYVGLFCFGDLISYVPGDIGHTYMCGQVSTEVYATYANFARTIAGGFTATQGQVLCRGYGQVTSSIPCAKFTDVSKSAGHGFAGNYPFSVQPFPEPINQTINVSKFWVIENSQPLVRGHVPGAWTLLHIDPFKMVSGSEGNTLTFTTGEMAGKTIECFYTGNSSRIWLEISNTW
jgi:hypothetical protein